MKKTTNQDMIKIIEQLDSIRVELMRSRDNHISELTGNGFTPLEALKDWQDNLSRIVLAMEEVTRQLRNTMIGTFSLACCFF
jgi:hypothetical protein